MTAHSEPAALALFASGTGTNFEAIVRAIREGKLPRVKPALLVCDKPGAQVVERAVRMGVPVLEVRPGAFPSKEDYEKKILKALQEKKVDTIALAGYMRLVGPTLIEAFPNRILNIHPSLLPAFPGLHAQRQAVSYGVKVSGVTVHYVDLEMDHGPIILQKAVPVLDGDTEESLTLRIRAAEHEAYVEALRLHSEGRLLLKGRTVQVC
ncbi:phosphoribosylglycinamide formyltransferase [Leptospirillum ferriphilum]|jgi:phosphoribosylglycinamide formyltransferase-1|uniref:Phosphoribosylglycinamide formyltransferase n=2 Tax=Leptospirillum TaxID=179 RepID=A0A094WEQ6_9BACT|nr:phosphoribosylglycinamide formyltransferase [Leptospirillum ferriphilum]EDZ40298.1 MAG: Phosphoribosylglycinamide formyltransferase [Leptospirillum sp. Group II '5-way CG']KGA94122.1 Phosphoribosylglycinamide formyltransferase [Leptospirillum ferriphilum]